MKNSYFLVILLFSLDSFAQNDMMGQWFLHYIEVDGVQQYSTIPNSFNDITFSDDNSFNGTVCNNGYAGSYNVIDNSNMSIPYVAAFGGFCNYPIESQRFLDPYLWNVLSDSNAVSDQFTYSIAGSGDEETLILTNNINNNSAFYGRSPLPENYLSRTWYLHSITKNNVEQVNSFSENFYLDFTLAPDFFSSIVYNGSAICNDYNGAYHLEALDKIRVDYFSFTLSICNQNGASLEESYFSFFSEAQTDTMLLDYTITGSGDNLTLIITDQNGDFLTYGSQTLSIDGFSSFNSNIKLNQNPVDAFIDLSIPNKINHILSYSIYSVEGKIVANSELVSPKISVNDLEIGLYFLVISSEHNFKQTLKFVKQ